MPRSPLAERFDQIRTIVAEAELRGVDPSAVTAVPQLSRRSFLRQVGVAAGLTVLPKIPHRSGPGTAPRIAIVGAGLAGLTAAYRLNQAGYTAQVYEASKRLGGRCFSDRTTFANGQIAEHGGELIDSGHTALQGLAREFGLPFDDLLRGEVKGSQPLYYFAGNPYTFAQATADFQGIWAQLQADAEAAGYPTTYNNFTPRAAELDKLSITDWIQAYVPGGLQSHFGLLLDVAYTIEFGAETSQQSSLNLISLLSGSPQTNLSTFGESDERYHIRGGNDRLVQALVKRLRNQITLESPLIAIRKNAADTYELTFQQASSTRAIEVDNVILTVPFAVLRDSVDYSQAGFSPRKQQAISELGMGTNSKLNLQFNRRVWREHGCNGDTYADSGYQATWESTRAQAGRTGILVNFTGGAAGADFRNGTADDRARRFLGQIEPVLPGISAAWNGRATVDYWTGNPWSRGSYSYWKVGQYTAFAGAEGERDGNCHFAGEHTSIEAQGYLEGAVASGERAAAEVAGG